MCETDRTTRLSVKKDTSRSSATTANTDAGSSGWTKSLQKGNFPCFKLPSNNLSLLRLKISDPHEIVFENSDEKKPKVCFSSVDIRDEVEVHQPTTSGSHKKESLDSTKSKLCIDRERLSEQKHRYLELSDSLPKIAYNKKELNHSALVCTSNNNKGFYFHEKKSKLSYEYDIRIGILEAEAKLKSGDFGETKIYQGKITGCKFYVKKDEILDSKTDSIVIMIHPYIVQILALYPKPERHFDIWMKYSGVDLLAYIMEFDRQQFTEETILKLGAQGRNALEFLHNLGFRHQQITPKAVLLTDSEKTGLEMKITNVCQTGSTITSQVLEYISPETILSLLCPKIKRSYLVNFHELAIVMIFMLVGRHVLRQIPVVVTEKASFAKAVIVKFLESPEYVLETCIPDGTNGELHEVLKDLLYLDPEVKKLLKSLYTYAITKKAFLKDNPKIPTVVFDCDHRTEWHALKENFNSSVGFNTKKASSKELDSLKNAKERERQITNKPMHADVPKAKSGQLADKTKIPRKRETPSISDEQADKTKISRKRKTVATVDGKKPPKKRICLKRNTFHPNKVTYMSKTIKSSLNQIISARQKQKEVPVALESPQSDDDDSNIPFLQKLLQK